MRARSCWLAGVLSLLVSQAAAHQELYHNVDLDLRDQAEDGSLKLSFIIHAPELLVSTREAAAAMYDEHWLATRTDLELNQLIARAREYLAQRFEVRLGQHAPLPLPDELLFDDLETIRSGSVRGLSPACLQATLRVPLRPGVGEFRVGHSRRSQKRLHLVVYRPKKFPEVIEVPPGQNTVVHLPNASPGEEPLPEPSPGSTRRLSRMILVIAILSLVVIWLRRGMRTSAR